MKPYAIRLLPVIFLLLGSFTTIKHAQESNVEFVCMKKQMAPNHCHYNFKVDGGKYHYVDIGCRFKRNDVIEKVKDGSLGLARDWKIACPEPKEKKEGTGY